VLRVGLTGGIGSGKSEVSKRLAAQGAVVIDADAVAREVVEPGTDGLAEVVEAFGREVLRPDGGLDRPKLGDVVFADPEADLEQAAGPGAIVVHDVPLIAENGRAGVYDVVVVVDSLPRTQIERLARHRGMTREQAKSRMAAQASREQRLAIADIVVDNSGSLAELDRQVGDLWAELRRRAVAASREDARP